MTLQNLNQQPMRVRVMNDSIRWALQTEVSTGVRAEDLLAMCLHETLLWHPSGISEACRDDAVGDSGKSFGAFQLHSHWHDVSADYKKRFPYQVRWTAIRMKTFGYDSTSLSARHYAIMRHNGSSAQATHYAQTVLHYSPQIEQWLDAHYGA
jgi:hypothetical protein